MSLAFGVGVDAIVICVAVDELAVDDSAFGGGGLLGLNPSGSHSSTWIPRIVSMFDDLGIGWLVAFCTDAVCVFGIDGLFIFAFATLDVGSIFAVMVPVALDVAFDIP